MSNEIKVVISDANKIITKVNWLSSNDYTSAEKNKVSNLPDDTNAQLAETEQRIDAIITAPVPTGEIIAQEIIDARQGAVSVGANITEVKTSLAQIVSETIKGNTGKKYKIVAGAIRNSGGVWSLINDADHEPVNIASVTSNENIITINYGFTAKKVVSLVCNPDETYVKHGVHFGASVGFSFSQITPIIFKTIGGYIYWTGTMWNIVNAKGVVSAVWNSTTSTLLITHEDMYHDDFNAYNVQVTARDGAVIPCVGSVGYTTIPVQFRDYSGALITTLTTDMKFYITRMTTGNINPSKLSMVGSNIWIYGIMEV